MTDRAVRGHDLDPWQLRDPTQFLRELDILLPLVQGLTVALVHHPSTSQVIVAAVTVAVPEPLAGDTAPGEVDREELSDLLREAATALWSQEDDDTCGRREHALMTVVARQGRVVLGPGEFHVLDGWRYSNHLLPVFSGDLFLVTPHGWRSFLDDMGGASPALR